MAKIMQIINYKEAELNRTVTVTTKVEKNKIVSLLIQLQVLSCQILDQNRNPDDATTILN